MTISPIRITPRRSPQPAPSYDGPTPQRIQHANDNFVIDPTTNATRMTDSQLDRLATAGHISPEHQAAGHRYHADHYAAGLAPLGAVDYARPVVDGSSPKIESDYRFAAYERWKRARPEGALGNLVDSVVLGDVATVSFVALRAGLDMLVKRYGVG